MSKILIIFVIILLSIYNYSIEGKNERRIQGFVSESLFKRIISSDTLIPYGSSFGDKIGNMK